MRSVALESTVDPNGYLSEAIESGKFVHGEDNQVKYYICDVNEQGEKK